MLEGCESGSASEWVEVLAHSNAKAKDGASVDGSSCFVLKCRVGVADAILVLILLFGTDERGRALYEEAL